MQLSRRACEERFRRALWWNDGFLSIDAALIDAGGVFRAFFNRAVGFDDGLAAAFDRNGCRAVLRVGCLQLGVDCRLVSIGRQQLVDVERARDGWHRLSVGEGR